MRVLITSDIFPPEVGWSATYVPVIARALVQRGHQVRVLVRGRGTPGGTDDEGYPFEMERMDVTQPRWRRMLQTGFRLFAHLRWADVVYVNGLLAETGFANRFLRKPAVARVTGDTVWELAGETGWTDAEFGPSGRGRLGREIEQRRLPPRRALRHMRVIVVSSASLQRIVSSWGIKPSRIQVVPNAFVEAPARAGSWPECLATPHRLITVGRLTTWQGIDDLLVAIVPFDDVGLLVVGEGPQRSSLESLARRLQLEQRVYFAGEMEREALIGAMRSSDLFVLNSRYEGLPSVMIEALAVGLPVVAAAAGGVYELITDGVNGRLVPVGDRAALRDAIRAALDDPITRGAWHDAGLAILRRFPLKVMVGRMVEILEGTSS